MIRPSVTPFGAQKLRDFYAADPSVCGARPALNESSVHGGAPTPSNAALSAYLSERGAAAVTAKLNAVYAQESSKLDPALAHAQLNRLADEAW